MRRSLGAVLILASLLLYSLGALGGGRDYVKDAFSRCDFVPHVYDDLDILKKYGAGTVVKHRGSISRLYFDSSSKLWVDFSGDAETSQKYRIVEEITIGSLRLPVDSFKYNGSLGGITLFGLGIGSKRSAVISAARRKYGMAIKSSSLRGHKLTEVYFHPSSDNTNLFYRFFLKDGVVVAFSIGVTE